MYENLSNMQIPSYPHRCGLFPILTAIANNKSLKLKWVPKYAHVNLWRTTLVCYHSDTCWLPLPIPVWPYWFKRSGIVMWSRLSFFAPPLFSHLMCVSLEMLISSFGVCARIDEWSRCKTVWISNL